jgi:hypothetical protein
MVKLRDRMAAYICTSTNRGARNQVSPADAESADDPASGFDCDDLATVVVAASGAQMVRALQFAAVLALGKSVNRECVMAATHAPA